MSTSAPTLATSRQFDCRYMVDAPAPGAWNMAVDETLLIDAADNGIATLRFYGWNEPTLSLGYFQRYDDRRQHAASRECAVVRRQTGGGAILHDRELTYSVLLPPTHPLARHNERIYTAVHQAFVDVLSPTIGSHPQRHSLKIRCASSSDAEGQEPFLCFQRRAPGDLVVVFTNASADRIAAGDRLPHQVGWKVLGSAQRRYRGAVLQHGSLLLERSPAAPELPGLGDLAGPVFTTAEVAPIVKAEVGRVLNLRLIELPWAPELQSKAEDLANNKYGDAGWTKRR